MENSVILEKASKLAKKLHKARASQIDKHNVLQCNKRARKLKKYGIRELKEIAKVESENMDVLAATYLLLDKQEKASQAYELMLPGRKDSSDAYPISKSRDFN